MIRRASPEIGLRIPALTHDRGSDHRRPTPLHRGLRTKTRAHQATEQVTLVQRPPKRVRSTPPPLSVTVERSRTDHGFDYVLCVRNKTPSLYDVSAQVTFQWGSEVELTQLTERDRKDLIEHNSYWLPVRDTNDVSAPLESDPNTVRFAFARQHQQMFQLRAVTRSGYFSPTGGVIDTAISPDNGKTIYCEVEFILSSLDQHDTETARRAKKNYLVGWGQLKEQPSKPSTRERHQRIANTLGERHGDGVPILDGYTKAGDLIYAPRYEDREWFANTLKDMKVLRCTDAEIEKFENLGTPKQEAKSEEDEIERLRSIVAERLKYLRTVADTYQRMARGATQ